MILVSLTSQSLVGLLQLHSELLHIVHQNDTRLRLRLVLGEETGHYLCILQKHRLIHNTQSQHNVSNQVTNFNFYLQPPPPPTRTTNYRTILREGCHQFYWSPPYHLESDEIGTEVLKAVCLTYSVIFEKTEGLQYYLSPSQPIIPNSCSIKAKL